MAVGRARRRVERALATIAVAVLGIWSMAFPAGAATDPGPQITEIVPVRIHGHDSSWPPVLVFGAVVVVGGAIFVCIVFLRRVREALRAEGSVSRRD